MFLLFWGQEYVNKNNIVALFAQLVPITTEMEIYYDRIALLLVSLCDGVH